MVDLMVNNTFLGMFCSLLFAFCVLLAVTKNYLVSAIAILTIGGIMGAMLTVIYCWGEGLGFAESLSIIVYVGLAVDYVVHIQH